MGLESKVHHLKQLSWSSVDLSNGADLLAVMTFEESTQVEVPFTPSQLDHSDAQLFSFFIPSISQIEVSD